jgi:hypothetical protein
MKLVLILLSGVLKCLPSSATAAQQCSYFFPPSRRLAVQLVHPTFFTSSPSSNLASCCLHRPLLPRTSAASFSLSSATSIIFMNRYGHYPTPCWLIQDVATIWDTRADFTYLAVLVIMFVSHMNIRCRFCINLIWRVYWPHHATCGP